MQIEPLSTFNAHIPPSMLITGSNDNNASTSSSQKPSTTQANCGRISKQAITPINSKMNLFKLLNNSKSAVIRTIGDRIVIPMKISSKTAFRSSNAKIDTTSTFQMALSTSSKSSSIQKSSRTRLIETISHDRNVTSNLANQTNNKAGKNIIVKAEPIHLECPVTNDLNKFMNSVSKSVFFPMSKCSALDSNNPDGEKESNNSNSLSQLNIKGGLDDHVDNELTSLTWLSSNNKELLKTIRKCNPDDPGIGMSGDDSDNDGDEDSGSKKLIFTASSRVNPQNSSSHQISNDFMYNPLCKPPYSFSCLIFMAIEDSYLKRLPVKAIYSWVCKHFPYYRSAPPGWKNSIRHNLSLNRCFRKANCRQDSAKGSLWCIDPAYRPNLVQALKRSPFYPYLHPTGVGQPLSLSNLANLLPGVYTGRVPTWTPALPPSTLWADPDMASAALNLLGLRGQDEVTSSNTELISSTLEEIFRDADWLDHSKNFRHRNDSTESIGTEELVIYGTDQDHTYSASVPSKKRVKRDEKRCKSPASEKSAPDAAYEFESRFSDDDLTDDVINEIMEDIVIDDHQSDAEDQSLFDSGFGSIKNFKVNGKCKIASGKALLSTNCVISKNNPIQKPTGRSSRYSKDNLLTREKACRLRKKPNSKSSKQLSKNKSSVRRQAKKKMSIDIDDRKQSDVDSGKDSPKCNRTARSRRFRERAGRINIKSNYNTRSSGRKLIKLELTPRRNSKKSAVRKRTRSFRRSNNATLENDDDEIKLAAGSLMRLAGLMRSPVKTDCT